MQYSKTCVRQPPLKLTLVVNVERWLSYKGTCHVILLSKLHDMYLYKTDNFFHINHYLKSVSKVALLHRFYCMNYKQTHTEGMSWWKDTPPREIPAGTWHLYNVGSTSMQRYEVASTLKQRCINIMCLLGSLLFKTLSWKLPTRRFVSQ